MIHLSITNLEQPFPEDGAVPILCEPTERIAA